MTARIGSGRGLATAYERFVAKTEPGERGCVLWTGCLNSRGYGCFSFGGKGKTVLAHRWVYEHFVGPIPAGLTIDHLCRVRRCVNPAHMEPVSVAENNRRGWSPPAKNARRTTCLRGHELILFPSGRRRCRECPHVRSDRLERGAS